MEFQVGAAKCRLRDEDHRANTIKNLGTKTMEQRLNKSWDEDHVVKIIKNILE
jgi:hypothetical protein